MFTQAMENRGYLQTICIKYASVFEKVIWYSSVGHYTVYVRDPYCGYLVDQDPRGLDCKTRFVFADTLGQGDYRMGAFFYVLCISIGLRNQVKPDKQ